MKCAAALAVMFAAQLATAQQSVIPATGCLFGIHAQSPDFKKDFTSDMNALLAAEAMVRRRFDVDRQYYTWDDVFPSVYDSWTSSQGRLPFLSWYPGRGNQTPVRWASIAAGAEDATVNARADDCKNFGSLIVLTFHHEPENQVDKPAIPINGTTADFIAAFRHIVQQFRARGATNVLFCVILYASDYKDGSVANFYPGDDVIDILGGDGYNFYPDRPEWVSFGQVFNGMHNFAVAHGKPAFVAEYGCQEDPAVPNRRAQWIADAEATVKVWPEFKALCYFEATADYNWRLETTTSAVNAFIAMGADPYFNVHFRPKHRAAKH